MDEEGPIKKTSDVLFWGAITGLTSIAFAEATSMVRDRLKDVLYGRVEVPTWRKVGEIVILAFAIGASGVAVVHSAVKIREKFAEELEV